MLSARGRRAQSQRRAARGRRDRARALEAPLPCATAQRPAAAAHQCLSRPHLNTRRPGAQRPELCARARAALLVRVRRAGGGRRAAHGTAGWPSTDSHFGRQFRLVRGWRRRWRRRRCTLSVRAMASAGILGGARQVTHAHRRARDGGEPSGRLVCPVPDAETARRCGRG